MWSPATVFSLQRARRRLNGWLCAHYEEAVFYFSSISFAITQGYAIAAGSQRSLMTRTLQHQSQLATGTISTNSLDPLIGDILALS